MRPARVETARNRRMRSRESIGASIIAEHGAGGRGGRSHRGGREGRTARGGARGAVRPERELLQDAYPPPQLHRRRRPPRPSRGGETPGGPSTYTFSWYYGRQRRVGPAGARG